MIEVYSLRHFYATMQLYDIISCRLSKQMGTSVEMLEKLHGQTASSEVKEQFTKASSCKEPGKKTEESLRF